MKRCLLLGLVGCGRLSFTSGPDGALDGESPDTPDAIALPAPDLWFKLDETSGNMMFDDGPLAAHATITGSFAWGNGRLRFTAPDGGGTTPVMPARYREPPATVSGWLQCTPRNDSTSVPAITVYEPFPPNAFSNDVPGSGGYGIGLNQWTDGTPDSAVMVGQGALIPVPGIACTQLRHVVAVYSSGQLDIYIDGMIAGSDVVLNLFGETGPFYIGRHNDDVVIYGTTLYYLGELDDLRVYLTALDAAQVRRLYNDGPQ